jgi:hypothetical protein
MRFLDEEGTGDDDAEEEVGGGVRASLADDGGHDFDSWLSDSAFVEEVPPEQRGASAPGEGRPNRNLIYRCPLTRTTHELG